MSVAVCVFCGVLKQGAVTPCGNCKKIPTTELDLAYSLALSSHYQELDALKLISSEIQHGKAKPALSPQDEMHMRAIAREWMKGPLYQTLVARSVASAGGERYCIGVTGKAEGSFNPSDQSIQIAKDAGNPEAVVRQMTLHAFRSWGTFTPGEWQILEKAARAQGWIEKRRIRQRYAHVYGQHDNREDIFLETAIAEEYGQSDPASYHRSTQSELAVFKLIEDGEMKARYGKQPAGKQLSHSRDQQRSILRRIATAYVVVGGLLATILWFSYLWPLTWGSGQYFPQMSFAERVWVIGKVQPVAVLYCGLRAFLWGPELVVWMIDDSGYSFGKWLAPGLYAEEWKMPER